jgi:hypothetical protein
MGSECTRGTGTAGHVPRANNAGPSSSCRYRSLVWRDGPRSPSSADRYCALVWREGTRSPASDT